MTIFVGYEFRKYVHESTSGKQNLKMVVVVVHHNKSDNECSVQAHLVSIHVKSTKFWVKLILNLGDRVLQKG